MHLAAVTAVGAEDGPDRARRRDRERRECLLDLLGDAAYGVASVRRTGQEAGDSRPAFIARPRELTASVEWRGGWRQRWAIEDATASLMRRFRPRRRATRRCLAALVAEGVVEHTHAHGFDWYRLAAAALLAAPGAGTAGSFPHPGDDGDARRARDPE